MLVPLVLALTLPLLDGDSWSPRDQQQLVPPGAKDGDRAGSTLAIDGDTMVVGSPVRRVATVERVGIVHTYERSGDTWVLGATIPNPDPDSHDRFGSAVTIEGDTLVVGASGESSFGNGQGALYVYERSGADWVLVQELRPAAGMEEIFLGISLDLEGDVLAAGTSRGLGDGSVHMYDRSAGTWVQRQILYEFAGSFVSPAFGNSVSLSEGRLAVGAPWWEYTGGPAGVVLVYEDSGSSWVKVATLHESDPYGGDNFGMSVSLRGSRLVIGCPWDVIGSTFPGSAIVFEEVAGVWSEVTKLVPGAAAHNQWTGNSITQWNDLLLVGGPGRFGQEIPGLATLFRHSPTGWCELASYSAQDPQAQDSFGSAVALLGEVALVGAPGPFLEPVRKGFVDARRISPPTNDFCFGDGSGTACPCAAGDAGRGCPNAHTAAGARLEVSGLPRTSFDSLRLHARDMGSTTVLFFQGSQPLAGGDGSVFGDGLRCVGGTVTRLGAVFTSGEATVPGATPLSILGSALVGETIYYQGWYRDSSGFCTAEPFNFTNAVAVTWEP